MGADRKFEKLKARWYAKLRLEAFHDIECPAGLLSNGNGFPLLIVRLEQEAVRVQATAEYYRWASHMIYDGNFRCPADKVIWAMHAEGQHHADIGIQLQLERSWISRRIRMIEKWLKTNK